MRKRLIALVFAAAAAFGLPFVGTAHAATVPAACVVGTVGPAHIQIGFAPNGPGDCTALP